MNSKRYTGEFKADAAKQVIDLGRPVREMAERTAGVSSYTLYEWVKKIRRKDPGLDLIWPTDLWSRRTGAYRPSSSG